ncbi:MAG: hypothetical protein JWO63_368, partial [Frankiales bacterium]|nr:hypothetical protein [Frankiales bacterium]
MRQHAQTQQIQLVAPATVLSAHRGCFSRRHIDLQ